MAGVTDTQSIRFGQVSDVVTHTMVANEADDIAVQLDAADLARTHALKRPQAYVSRSASFNLPVSTITVVTFDVINWDTHSMVNLATFPQRVTVGATAGTGIYHCYVRATPDTTSWTKGDVILQKNGAFHMQKTAWQPVSFSTIAAEFFVNMALTTDYLSVAMYHEGGGTTAVSGVEFYVQKISD